MEWPTDVLVHFLEALAAICDRDAQRAWHQLAFLTCKREALSKAAKIMPRPILLRIEIEADADENGLIFKIPFMQATVLCVDVDWGDGCVDTLQGEEDSYAEHTYTAPGTYCVRVFPARDLSNEAASLDHLGFETYMDKEDSYSWWKPLREVVSLGNIGLRSLSYLFAHSGELRVNLKDLCVSGIQDFSGMFLESQFNQPIGTWDVSSATNMSHMFEYAAEFDHPLGNWNVSNVTDMSNMFHGASLFNQPVGQWNVSNVTNMNGMFSCAEVFNQPIGNWNVSNVTNLSGMFDCASSFNQPIGLWNVSKVTNMSKMFWAAGVFNQPIGDWDVTNVTDMSCMFWAAEVFNQPIGNWDVTNVTDMGSMFLGALTFNQPINNWNVSNVKDMNLMFMNASAFHQPIGQWKLNEEVDVSKMAHHSR
jgi:surface protein